VLSDEELRKLREEIELNKEVLKAEQNRLIAKINLQFRDKPEIRDMLLRPLKSKRGPKPKRVPGSLFGYSIQQAKKVSKRFTVGLLGGSFQVEKPKRGRPKTPREKLAIIGDAERIREETGATYFDAVLALLYKEYEQEYGKEPELRARKELEGEAGRIVTFIHNHKRKLSSR
jgi:hypothetical protein